ncbi:TetR/AcrR family transcriptional regulator [Telluribacter humicola]|uniref:TetR/AcrR family transcriptional regulator n=1 Tax=Telluribacter humicola TaxID=1720261 RepID=UPI001A9690DA|nr:TetR/AcrR family transcriptional regulator [Telluribacter humicola]
MGIAERKEREKEEMRELILRAASKIFMEDGFEKTSIRKIADAIEYSPATIYLYYRDKNELLHGLHVEAFQKMMQEFAQVVPISDPFARLVEMGHQYIKFGTHNPELYNLMFLMDAPMEAIACRNEIWDDGLRAFDALRVVVADCIKAGYFKETDVETISMTIWSYIHGLVTIYLKGRMKMFDDDRELERMQQSFSLFIKMLKAI